MGTTVEDLLISATTDGRWRNPDLWTLDETASANEAARLMAAKNVGCIAITCGGVKGHSRGPVVGVLTERDFMRKIVVAEKKHKDATVGEIATMGTGNIIVATKEDSVRDCLALMIDRNIRHLPVVDDGEVTGLLSMRDLARQMIQDHRIELRDLFSASRPRV
jgi:CBS domain-containing protein